MAATSVNVVYESLRSTHLVMLILMNAVQQVDEIVELSLTVPPEERPQPEIERCLRVG